MLDLKQMIDKLLAALQGRTTAFCVAFFAAGNVLHILHRLDQTYIMFMATLMGFVVGHSIKEDYFAGKKPDERKDA
jgi:hypothetical protein